MRGLPLSFLPAPLLSVQPRSLLLTQTNKSRLQCRGAVQILPSGASSVWDQASPFLQLPSFLSLKDCLGVLGGDRDMPLVGREASTGEALKWFYKQI